MSVGLRVKSWSVRQLWRSFFWSCSVLGCIFKLVAIQSFHLLISLVKTHSVLSNIDDSNALIIWNVKHRCKKDEANAILTKLNIPEMNWRQFLIRGQRGSFLSTWLKWGMQVFREMPVWKMLLNICFLFEIGYLFHEDMLLLYTIFL